MKSKELISLIRVGDFITIENLVLKQTMKHIREYGGISNEANKNVINN